MTQTDQILKEMEKHLTQIYKTAQNDISKKIDAYFDKYTAADSKKRKQLQAGEITEAEYKAWQKGQLMTGSHWYAMEQQISKEISSVNKTAAAYINGKLPEVYALNYNEIGDQINGVVKGYSFELVDAHTVKNLATSDKTLLPYKTVDGKKDERWNTKRVNAEVMQGIIQGESIPHLASRLSKSIPEMNRDSAIRNARTTVTSAENKGRMDSYHAAEEMGIVVKKRWVATHDLRTRPEHAELDGVEIDVDEPFVNSYGEIMYPGDPDADPANVYNCRCRLVSQIVGFKKANGQVTTAEQQEQEDEPEKERFKSDKLKKSLGDDYDDFTELVGNAENRDLYERFSEKVNLRKETNGGYYQSMSGTLSYSLENAVGRSKYTVLAHEYGHSFDYALGKVSELNFSEIDTINKACKKGFLSFTTIKEVPSQCDEFLAAMRKDAGELRKSLKDKTLLEAFRKTQEIRNASAGVQDVLDGFYGTRDSLEYFLPWGHGNRYYNRAYNHKIKDMGLEKELKQAFQDLGFDASNQTKVKSLMRQYEASSELWANVSSAVTCGGAELEVFEKYMPETLKAYRSILKKIGGK